MKKNKFFMLLFLLFAFIGTQFVAPISATIPTISSEPIVVYLPTPANPRGIIEFENTKPQEPEVTVEYKEVEIYKERFITKEVPVYIEIEVAKHPRISEKALEKLAPIKMAGISKETCPDL